MIGSDRTRSRRATRLNGLMNLEPRQMLAGDLVAHWNANDLIASLPDGGVVETAWVDRVQGLAADVLGTPVFELDQIGGRGAIRFDASDGIDRLLVDSRVSPLSGASDFTVVVAFRTDSQQLEGDGTGPWFNNTGVVDANQRGFGNDWGLTMSAAGQLSTGMGGGFAAEPVSVYSTPTGLNDGELHLAFAAHDSGTLRLHVDGNVVDEVAGVPSDARSNLDISIGSRTDRSGPFTGQIAEVRIYDGALDAAEVDTLRNELTSFYSNQPPQAMADVYDLDEDQAIFLVPANTGVLANDVDADGDALTARLVTDVSHGTLGFNANGSFLYTPNADFNGVDQFTYSAFDFRNSEPVTVTLNVAAVYDAPRAIDDEYKIRPGEQLSLPGFIGVMVNDENPDDADLTVELVQDVNAGSLDLAADGGFTYDPGEFQGIARFTYQLNDGAGVSEPAEVVVAVNTRPIAVDDLFTVIEDTVLVLDPSMGPLANDIDAQADNTLTVRLLEAPSIGDLELEPDGGLRYTPPQDFVGSTQFAYRVSDGFEESANGWGTLNIVAVNDAPVATPESYLALADQTLVIPAAAGLLANDTDVEGDALTAAVATAPDHGTLELATDGSFQYVPNPGFVGEDAFEYVVQDAEASSTPSTVTLIVGSSPIQISEIMTRNTEVFPTRLRDEPDGRFRGDDQFYDWVELTNSLPIDVNLTGLHLTDDADHGTAWQFPAGATIPASGRIVVFASGLDIQDGALDETASFHTNFELSGGEYLALTSYDGAELDAFPRIPEQFTNVAYGINSAGDPRYFETPTPGDANGLGQLGRTRPVTFDLAAGFYDAPQQLTIAGPAQATIHYTVDGSEPTRDSLTYQGPITIERTSTIRAAAVWESYLVSEIETATFLFLDDIVEQSPDGTAPEGWPEDRVRGQVFDYGMDPNIVNDPTWGPQLKDALTQISTISLVTDLDNLVDRDIGIYVRAEARGRAWERDVSVELINPSGEAGFQIDAGIRMRGGFSRNAFNPKHSFRLFFRDVYGGELEFPLFEQEGVDEFRNVDLRTAQNYAWSNDTFNDETRNSFLRDVFSRDLQRDLGQHYTRSRYYHLYVNGQYWGLYQTEERAEASYAESYVGGDNDHYDVIKASGGTLEATDGDLQPWNDLWAIAREGFSNREQYYAIQGKNADGSDNPDLPVHVLPDALIDFVINYTFTANEDMPTSLGGGNANNFWGFRNPNGRDGWQFIAHDNEHNMLDVNEDQTRPTTTGTTAGSFNPAYLHQQLMEVPEYRLRFADRIQKFFFNDGPLTTENSQARMQARIDQIDQAIIAESARWGDQHHVPALTKADWEAEVDWLMNTFLGQRREIVLQQYRNRGLFPDVEAAKFNQHGGFVQPGFELTMSAPVGTVYYSLDGTDPRMSGGAINENATAWTGDPVTLEQDATVSARVWTGTEWSPLVSTRFDVGEAIAPNGLRISEVHYHPAAPTEREQAAGFDDADDFEFVEFVNPTDQPIDLSQARLIQLNRDDRVEGVEFLFGTSDHHRLAPGERVVVVEDDAAFRMRYGNSIPIAGTWSGRLSNANETLTVLNGDQLLQQFAYSDAWLPLTDGAGFSLEMINPSETDRAVWGTREGWRLSAHGGSPGTAAPVVGDVNADGVFSSDDLLAIMESGTYEDDIDGNATGMPGDFDGDGDLTTADIVFAFQFGFYS